jgi:hypothetical protein
MHCHSCHQKILLKFNGVENNGGQFIWACPECKTDFPYIPPEDRFDFSRRHPGTVIESLKDTPTDAKEEIENEIKAQMVEILIHFIRCDWSPHYNTMFDLLIMVYLDDPDVLDYVLKNAVRYTGIKGKSGANIYSHLMKYLRLIKSSKIQNYLNNEFENCEMSL